MALGVPMVGTISLSSQADPVGLSSLVRQRVRMHDHTLNHDRRLRPIFLVDLNLLHLVQCLPTL